MMHQLVWVRGRLRSLLLPYLKTGIPSLLFLMSLITLLEMAHATEENLHIFGLTLNPASTPTWLIIVLISAGAFFVARRSLPQLKSAWDSANHIPNEER